jgi:hypothetical protein
MNCTHESIGVSDTWRICSKTGSATFGAAFIRQFPQVIDHLEYLDRAGVLEARYNTSTGSVCVTGCRKMRVIDELYGAGLTL